MAQRNADHHAFLRAFLSMEMIREKVLPLACERNFPHSYLQLVIDEMKA